MKSSRTPSSAGLLLKLERRGCCSRVATASLVCAAALLCAAAASPPGAAAPLACTPAATTPTWPTFHIIGNVSANETSGRLQAAPLNDANAVFSFRGVWHVMHQGGGGNWSHVVSSDLARWFRLPDALGREWDNKVGPCDGTISFPGGDQGVVAAYGVDCNSWTSAPRGAPLGAPLGDAPRVSFARPRNASDAYLLEWIEAPVNVTFADGANCSFPGKVWRSVVGNYYNMVCSLFGLGQWARFTSTDDALLTWALADANFTRPFAASGKAGDLWNAIPGAEAGGPTHMINGLLGGAFWLGTYDAQREVLDITTPLNYIDVGGVAPQWAATSNDVSEDPRVLWLSWLGPGLGALSLVRSLFWDAASRSLASFPAAEYEGLRNATFVGPGEDLGPLAPGALLTLPVPAEAGGALDVLVSFAVPEGVSGGFGVAVRAPPGSIAGAALAVTFDVAAPDADGARNVTVGGDKSGPRWPRGCPHGAEDADETGAGAWAAEAAPPPPLPPPTSCPSNATRLFPGELLSVRILVDRPIVEVFVLGGRLAWVWAGGRPFSPANASVHVFNAGSVAVRATNASVFGMDCGFRSDLPPPRSGGSGGGGGGGGG